MSIQCQVIRDLILVYQDKRSSEATNHLIMQHMSECPSCRRYFVKQMSLLDGEQSGERKTDDHHLEEQQFHDQKAIDQKPGDQQHRDRQADGQNLQHQQFHGHAADDEQTQATERNKTEEDPLQETLLYARQALKQRENEQEADQHSKAVNTTDQADVESTTVREDAGEVVPNDSADVHANSILEEKENRKTSSGWAVTLLLKIAFFGGAAAAVAWIALSDKSSSITAFSIIYPILSYAFGYLGYFTIRKWWKIPLVIFALGCLTALFWFNLQPLQSVAFYIILSLLGTASAWACHKLYQSLQKVRDENEKEDAEEHVEQHQTAEQYADRETNTAKADRKRWRKK